LSRRPGGTNRKHNTAEEAIMAKTTLVKDGKERTVTRPEDVVRLKFNGWKIKKPAAPVKAPDKK
jgi:hypothetical protein